MKMKQQKQEAIVWLRTCIHVMLHYFVKLFMFVIHNCLCIFKKKKVSGEIVRPLWGIFSRPQPRTMIDSPKQAQHYF